MKCSRQEDWIKGLLEMVVKAQKEVVKAESEYKVRTLDDEIRSIELQRVRDEANNWQRRCEQLNNELDALKAKTE